MNTPDDALHALNTRGFRYIPAPGYTLGGGGHVPWTLLFVYGWDAPYVDAVHVRGADDVTAFRTRLDDDRDDLSGESIVWKRESDIVEAVADLLALAAPGEPGAPSLVIRAPSRLWIPADGATKSNLPVLPSL